MSKSMSMTSSLLLLLLLPPSLAPQSSQEWGAEKRDPADEDDAGDAAGAERILQNRCNDCCLLG
ncbi:hypothetical protein E4U55_000318, partial [Claviceps digitariae]